MIQPSLKTATNGEKTSAGVEIIPATKIFVAVEAHVLQKGNLGKKVADPKARNHVPAAAGRSALAGLQIPSA